MKFEKDRAARAGVAIMGACGLFTAAAHAHHSPAAYDLAQEVFVEGAVVDVVWANPHIYLTIETRAGDGVPSLRQVEAAPIATVQTTGLRKEHVALGTPVIVRAHPSRRDPARTVLGRDVTLPDGSIYPLNPGGRESRPIKPLVAAETLAGRWTSTPQAFLRFALAASLARQPTQTVPTWPLTDTARAVLQDRSAQAAYATCDGASVPLIMVHQMLRTIEVGERTVRIRLDALGVIVERVVHLDQTAHPAAIEPSAHGHSIGRWEGGTLVVDTVGFLPNRVGFPSGPRKHLVERLTLTDEGRRIHYAFTMEDPDYLAAAVSFDGGDWYHRPDLEFSGAECDPDVARRFLDE